MITKINKYFRSYNKILVKFLLYDKKQDDREVKANFNKLEGIVEHFLLNCFSVSILDARLNIA